MSTGKFRQEFVDAGRLQHPPGPGEMVGEIALGDDGGQAVSAGHLSGEGDHGRDTCDGDEPEVRYLP